MSALKCISRNSVSGIVCFSASSFFLISLWKSLPVWACSLLNSFIMDLVWRGCCVFWGAIFVSSLTGSWCDKWQIHCVIIRWQKFTIHYSHLSVWRGVSAATVSMDYSKCTKWRYYAVITLYNFSALPLTDTSPHNYHNYFLGLMIKCYLSEHIHISSQLHVRCLSNAKIAIFCVFLHLRAKCLSLNCIAFASHQFILNKEQNEIDFQDSRYQHVRCT